MILAIASIHICYQITWLVIGSTKTIGTINSAFVQGVGHGSSKAIMLVQVQHARPQQIK